MIEEADRDFNQTIFYGQDADVDYVVGAAKQFPVMAGRRLVLLKEAQSMDRAKTTLDRFAPYVENPAPATVFAIIYKGEPLSATSALMKAAKASGATVFRSDIPRDYELLGHARDYCTERRISIEETALQLMCECIGTPLEKLFGELNKLTGIKGPGRITLEDVRRNIGNSKEYSGFEFADALGSKNYPKAMQIVKYMEDTGGMDTMIMGTAQAFNLFANVVTAHYQSDKSDEALKEALGFKAAVQLRNLKTAMRNYNPAQAVNAIHYLREFDTKSKGIDSASNRYSLLRETVFKLFT